MRLEEIKSIASLLDNDEEPEIDAELIGLEGDALKLRQELDDLYE